MDWAAPIPGTRRVAFAGPHGPLAAVIGGRGPAVLLLPGITGSKEDFALVIPTLIRAGFRVGAVDLAGQYQSAGAGPAPGGRYDCRLFADDVLALLAAMGPAHLLGYSFAGIVAQAVALRRPGLVASLALMSVPPLPGNALAGVKVVGPLLGERVGPRAAAAILTAGIRLNLNGVPPSRWRFVRARLHRTAPQSIVDAMDMMRHNPDVCEELRALPLRILVIACTHDLWSMKLHRRFARRIGAELVTYRTGHSPCETAPRQLSADLLRFYRGR